MIWTGGWTDRQTERQTDREMNVYLGIFPIINRDGCQDGWAVERWIGQPAVSVGRIDRWADRIGWMDRSVRQTNGLISQNMNRPKYAVNA